MLNVPACSRRGPWNGRRKCKTYCPGSWRRAAFSWFRDMCLPRSVLRCSTWNTIRRSGPGDGAPLPLSAGLTTIMFHVEHSNPLTSTLLRSAANTKNKGGTPAEIRPGTTPITQQLPVSTVYTAAIRINQLLLRSSSAVSPPPWAGRPSKRRSEAPRALFPGPPFRPAGTAGRRDTARIH